MPGVTRLHWFGPPCLGSSSLYDAGVPWEVAVHAGIVAMSQSVAEGFKGPKLKARCSAVRQRARNSAVAAAPFLCDWPPKQQQAVCPRTPRQFVVEAFQNQELRGVSISSCIFAARGAAS